MAIDWSVPKKKFQASAPTDVTTASAEKGEISLRSHTKAKFFEFEFGLPVVGRWRNCEIC